MEVKSSRSVSASSASFPIAANNVSKKGYMYILQKGVTVSQAEKNNFSSQTFLNTVAVFLDKSL